MPLLHGGTRAIISANIARLRAEGMPEKRAVAAAYREARESGVSIPGPRGARSMATKKKKHHGHHAKKKKHHGHHAKAHHPKRSKKKKHHTHRACPMCGHRSAHGRAGCMHVSGNKICPCKG